MRLPILLATIAAFLPTAASAAWHEASADHFLVLGDLPERQIREQAEALERFDRAIRLLLNMSDDTAQRANRVTVYMVSGLNTVARLCGRCGQGIAGFYRPAAGRSFAVMPRRSGEGEFDLKSSQIMQHEYAHVLMFENSDRVYPAWYTEGFAEFVATARLTKDGGYAFGEAPLYRAWSLVQETPPAITTLLAPVRLRQNTDLDSFYARSWLLTHYLTSDGVRGKQLVNYLERFNRGEPSLDAARAAFGDLSKLHRALNVYLTGKLYYWKMPPGKLTPGTIKVRALRPGEAAFMPFRLRSVAGVDTEQAQALVAPARKTAASYPDDPWVQGALAEVEYDAGNDDEAEAAADRALAIDPKASQALLYKGRVRVRRAVKVKATDPEVWRKARSWFARANRDEPDRAEPLKLYYESFRAAGAMPTANATVGLRRALELAPQDKALRTMVAAQEVRDGRLAEAKAALRPLAYDPHAGTDNSAAALLTALDKPDGIKAAQAMLVDLAKKEAEAP